MTLTEDQRLRYTDQGQRSLKINNLNNKGIRTPRQERHTEIQDVKHFFKKERHSPGCQD